MRLERKEHAESVSGDEQHRQSHAQLVCERRAGRGIGFGDRRRDKERDRGQKEQPGLQSGGGLAFDIGTLPVGGAAGIGLTIIGIEQTVDSLINDSSPDSLRKWNEENLLKLGANRDLIIQFLNHPWYTLKQATTVTASLNKTETNPDLFLENANKALTEQDARYFEQVAQLLAAYSQKVAPLQSLRLQDELLCAVDRNGVLLVPVSLDYAIWTAAAARRVDALAGLAGSDSNIKSIQIWTDGKASERVKAELGKRALGYQSFSLIKAD